MNDLKVFWGRAKAEILFALAMFVLISSMITLYKKDVGILYAKIANVETQNKLQEKNDVKIKSRLDSFNKEIVVADNIEIKVKQDENAKKIDEILKILKRLEEIENAKTGVPK